MSMTSNAPLVPLVSEVELDVAEELALQRRARGELGAPRLLIRRQGLPMVVRRRGPGHGLTDTGTVRRPHRARDLLVALPSEEETDVAAELGLQILGGRELGTPLLL